MAKSTLPKVIYVRRELDGENEYLYSNADLNDVVTSQTEEIGRYELVSTKKMKLVPAEV